MKHFPLGRHHVFKLWQFLKILKQNELLGVWLIAGNEDNTGSSVALHYKKGWTNKSIHLFDQ